jgi:hypothetical protein
VWVEHVHPAVELLDEHEATVALRLGNCRLSFWLKNKPDISLF